MGKTFSLIRASERNGRKHSKFGLYEKLVHWNEVFDQTPAG